MIALSRRDGPQLGLNEFQIKEQRASGSVSNGCDEFADRGVGIPALGSEASMSSRRWVSSSGLLRNLAAALLVQTGSPAT